MANKKREDFVKKSIYAWPFFLGGKCAGMFLLFSALRMRDVQELDARQKEKIFSEARERERAMDSIDPPALVRAYAFKINWCDQIIGIIYKCRFLEPRERRHRNLRNAAITKEMGASRLAFPDVDNARFMALKGLF